MIRDSEIQSDIISRLNNLKSYKEVSAITIEKSETIDGIMIVLYSVDNLPKGSNIYGLATCKSLGNGRLKPLKYIVNNANKEDFETKFINLNDSSPYLLLYGFNHDNATQVYKHTSKDKVQTVEFSGRYFLEMFPGDAGNRFERVYN